MSNSVMQQKKIFDEIWANPALGSIFPAVDTSLIIQQLTLSAGVGSVLDIGCGDGKLVRDLCVHGYDAQGVDVSDVAISRANKLCVGRFKLGSATNLPFHDKSIDILTCINVIEYLSESDVVKALGEMRRVARRSVLLRISTQPPVVDGIYPLAASRDWWERLCIEAGLRKHPNTFHVTSYPGLENEGAQLSILLEPVPEHALQSYPLTALREERDLHMDMGREAGRRSDAHMVRYHEASRYIRKGDRVLDAACGLGYGSHIMKQNSLCRSVHGIDGSDYAIDYANKNYGREGKISFSKGFLPDCLNDFEDGAFDFIASFETLEHLENPLDFLAECKRILSPGGRLLVSVPNDWTEEDGKDPNPHHFHVYYWETLQKQVETVFSIEKAFGQTASRLKRNGQWASHGRAWDEVNLAETLNAESEWCLVLATKDPIGTTQPFFDRHNPIEATVTTPVTFDFANQYENPWLITSLISIGMRTENTSLLLDYANKTISTYDGADAAAAYCVQGYNLISIDASIQEIEAWEKKIKTYIEDRDWNSSKEIEIRWAISLLYVLSILNKKIGKVDESISNLLLLIRIPFLKYSPLIATKVVEAQFNLGLFYWQKADVDNAQRHFLEGVKAAEAAVTVNWVEVFGPLTSLPRFVTAELSYILDFAMKCSVALSYVSTELPHGKIFLEVLWNRDLEINNMRRSIDGLNLNIQQYEKTKREYYEPKIQQLESRNRTKLETQDDNFSVDQAALRRRMMHHIEMVRRLVTNIKQLEAQLAEANKLRTEWFEPQLEHLNARIVEYEKTKREWFEPQLQSQQASINELQNYISSIQNQIDEVTAFRRGRAFRVWRKLYPVVWRIRSFLRLN